METYFISMGITVILQSLKKPELKRKFRNAFLKLFLGIKQGFADDPDFQ